MKAYEAIKFLMETTISQYEIEQQIKKMINIENLKMKDVYDGRNLISSNASILYSSFNDILEKLNTLKAPQIIFTDAEIAKILAVSVATVKAWRSSDALKYDQPSGRGSKVSIRIEYVEEFVSKNSRYKKKWEMNKNNL